MSVNPYEPPARPEPNLPGVKYLVDRRKLTLGEWCQLTKYPLKGYWVWLSLQLGIDREPTCVYSVPRVREMAAELADMPAGVGELLMEMQAFAETCGFFGRWTSMTFDGDGHISSCIFRMLSHDPRTYLEIAFVGIDHLFISRHNLVSATTGGEYLVTSNGFPAGKRAPVVKPQYFNRLPFDQLLAIHRQRINAWPQPFREVRTFEDMTMIVQELVDSFTNFQIARGYYTPLEENNPTGIR